MHVTHALSKLLCSNHQCHIDAPLRIYTLLQAINLLHCVLVQAGAHVKKHHRQQANEAVSCFLELIRAEFLHNKHLYNVHSIVVSGVDSLRHLLHDVNM